MDDSKYEEMEKLVKEFQVSSMLSTDYMCKTCMLGIATLSPGVLSSVVIVTSIALLHHVVILWLCDFIYNNFCELKILWWFSIEWSGTEDAALP